MILEIGIDITTALKLRNRFFPATRIWSSIRDISGRRTAWKKPDIDICARPFGRDDTASDAVEVCAVGLRILVLDTAARVRALVGCVNVAVCVAERAGEVVVVGDGAAGGGV